MSTYRCDVKMNRHKMHSMKNLVNLCYTCNPNKLAVSENTKSQPTFLHIVYNFLDPTVF